MRTLFTSILLLTSMATAMAQAPSWLEDNLYGGGKMNGVVAVVTLIIAGIGLWLWAQDRRLKRMEDRIKRSDDQTAHGKLH
jgi:uncharacterized protein HemX